MISFEEIQRYLPQYLSDTSQKTLFEELKHFPQNIDQRLYSMYLSDDDVVYQGDGLKDMLVVNLPHPEARPLPVMVCSNTCDIDPVNKRFFASRMVYAPIFQLEKYRLMLRNGNISSEGIDAHIRAIKQQSISQIFYLPKGGRLECDSIVFLDRLNNYPVDVLNKEEIKKKKLFTLSNYGFYMFLVKLSIHFTRIREDVDRVST